MLLRLAIDGFKNLSGTEIALGPFTCFAGANAVGKSNIFDVMMFLRDLSNFSIMDAAARVRDPKGRTGDPRAIFFRSKRSSSSRLEITADLLVSPEVTDDFGRAGKPQTTFLRYSISLRLSESDKRGQSEIHLEREELTTLSREEARSKLGFPFAETFLKATYHGSRRKDHPITTEEDGGQPVIVVRDQQGRPIRVPAKNSPRTVLGGTNSNSHPTILAARREMQSWKLLQLEPSALRSPDAFSADPHLTETGEHLPSTLTRLGAHAVVANRLAELVPDVVQVNVDEDEARRQRSLNIVARDGVPYPARSLSDGSLRFLALAVLANDPEAGTLICMEEPENGIHPARIPPLLDLLLDIAVDPMTVVDEANPLRQVIVNTHSPVVVSRLAADDVVFVQGTKSASGKGIALSALAGSWRQRAGMNTVAPGALAAYLDGSPPALSSKVGGRRSGRRSVFDVGRQLGFDLSSAH